MVGRRRDRYASWIRWPECEGADRARTATVLGHVFVFRGRWGDIVKLLWWDGDGLCLFSKRLERERFIWPQATEGTVCLTRAAFSKSQTSL